MIVIPAEAGIHPDALRDRDHFPWPAPRQARGYNKNNAPASDGRKKEAMMAEKK